MIVINTTKSTEKAYPNKIYLHEVLTVLWSISPFSSSSSSSSSTSGIGVNSVSSIPSRADSFALSKNNDVNNSTAKFYEKWYSFTILHLPIE